MPVKQEIWLATAGEQLYDEAMQNVTSLSREAAAEIGPALPQPLSIVAGPTITTAGALKSYLIRAEESESCMGIVVLLRSPASFRAWMPGLPPSGKALCFLHHDRSTTLPAGDLDRVAVVVGNASTQATQLAIGNWARAVSGHSAYRAARVSELPGIDVLVEREDRGSAETRQHVERYLDTYKLPSDLGPSGERHDVIVRAAMAEAAARQVLASDGAAAFTAGRGEMTGLVVQHLMASGYGFAPNGDESTARLVRSLKVMGSGQGGTSYAEGRAFAGDTGPNQVADIYGPHSLDLCPSLSTSAKPLDVFATSHGARTAAPRVAVRMAFQRAFYLALALPSRHAVIVNSVKASAGVDPAATGALEMVPSPNWGTASACWNQAGSPVNAAITTNVESAVIQMWCRLCGLDFLAVEDHTTLRSFSRAWDGS